MDLSAICVELGIAGWPLHHNRGLNTHPDLPGSIPALGDTDKRVEHTHTIFYEENIPGYD